MGWAEFQKMIPTEVEDHHRGTMTVAAPGGKHAKARAPGAPMRTGTCGEVAAQKRRGTSAAWLDFGSLLIIMAWVGPDSKLSPSWRGLLFCCGRWGTSPQPHPLVGAPRGGHCYLEGA